MLESARTGPLVRAAAEGLAVECFGTRYVLKATASETGGRVGLFEGHVPPGDGPPMHVHRREDEIFHIVEGLFRIWCGGQTWDVDPGAVVLLPRGVPHTFRNTGPGTGRLLTTVVPGGFEGFFPLVAERGLAVPDDMGELQELAASFGLEFVGPPPWAGGAPGQE
jgi:mannose-6-phosphate isomerase-like protein (cupin superfamily)